MGEINPEEIHLKGTFLNNVLISKKKKKKEEGFVLQDIDIILKHCSTGTGTDKSTNAIE